MWTDRWDIDEIWAEQKEECPNAIYVEDTIIARNINASKLIDTWLIDKKNWSNYILKLLTLTYCETMSPNVS